MMNTSLIYQMTANKQVFPSSIDLTQISGVLDQICDYLRVHKGDTPSQQHGADLPSKETIPVATVLFSEMLLQIHKPQLSKISCNVN